MMRCIVFLQSRYINIFCNVYACFSVPLDIVKIYALDNMDTDEIFGNRIYNINTITEIVEFDTVLLFTDLAENVRKLIGKVYPNMSKFMMYDCMEIVKCLLSKEGKMLFLKNWIELEYPRDSSLRFLTIGDFTYFGNINVMSEIRDGSIRCRIGKFCSSGPNLTVLLGEEHNVRWNTTYPFKKMLPFLDGEDLDVGSKGDVIIGNDVWIGKNVIILSGVKIGTGCVIGAGAVVTHSFEPYSIVAGNPAKLIRKRFDDKKIQRLLECKWWDLPYDKLYDILPKLQSDQG